MTSGVRWIVGAAVVLGLVITMIVVLEATGGSGGGY
jgi:hypothetical protein